MPTKKRKQDSSSFDSVIGPSSPLSSHSSGASNDLHSCITDYFEMADKKSWKDWEEQCYVNTYIAWQTNGEWDPTNSTAQNFAALAAFLRTEYGITVTGTQCQTKYYRLMEKWRLFTDLRGDSSKPETGIGWDEEHRCFLAGQEQWAYLYEKNHSYLDFQHPNSADLYIIWDGIAKDKTATGSRAKSAAQPPPQYVPPRHRRRREECSDKGKGVACSSVINPIPRAEISDEDNSPCLKNPGKRPMSSRSLGSDKTGSKRSKSAKSGSENYQEALSNFSRFSCAAVEERETRALYSIPSAKKVVDQLNLDEPLRMALLNEMLSEDFRALFLSLSESEQRAWIELFIRPKLG